MEEKTSLWENIREIRGLMGQLKRVFINRWNHFGAFNLRLGQEQLAKGQGLDAVFRFRLALWKQPGNADAWAGLGEAYLLMEKRDKARLALRRALALQPGHPRAESALAALG